MTYSVGQSILAADDFSGPIASTSPYASDLAATEKVAALIGVGYGSRGYGQSTPVLTPVTAGSPITATHTNAIISAIGLMNTHTGEALTLPSPVVVGGAVDAFDGTHSRPSLPLIITTLDTDRLSFDISQMTLSSVLTGTRVDPWATSIYHEYTITFPDEDRARYFFNTGGHIYMTGSRTGGSATHINVAFTDLLAAMGTIKIGAIDTTYTGTGGTPTSIGYFGLTTSYQTLFTHLGSTYGYTSASYTLQAKAESVIGVNGGNGSVLRIQAVFATGSAPSVVVNGTLTSSVSQLLADGVLTVTAPTYASGAPYNNSTF